MTTQADIAVAEAITMLETLGNQVAKQAAVIEKLRGALEKMQRAGRKQGWQQNYESEMNACGKALAIPTDSTQILQEWLDEKLGEPVAFETSDYRLVHRTTRQDIVPLFKKPELME